MHWLGGGGGVILCHQVLSCVARLTCALVGGGGVILCHQVLSCVARLTCALVVNRSALQPAGHPGGEPEQQAVLRVLLRAQSGCATPLSCGRHQLGEVLHQAHQRHVSHFGCLVMTVVF